MGIAIASFIAGIAIIPLIPQGFIPQLDRGEFYLNYTVPLAQSQARPAGAPVQDPRADPAAIDPRAQLLQQTLAAADPLEDIVFDLSEVDSVLTTVGGQGRPNQGSLYIKLKGDRTS